MSTKYILIIVGIALVVVAGALIAMPEEKGEILGQNKTTELERDIDREPQNRESKDSVDSEEMNASDVAQDTTPPIEDEGNVAIDNSNSNEGSVNTINIVNTALVDLELLLGENYDDSSLDAYFDDTSINSITDSYDI